MIEETENAFSVMCDNCGTVSQADDKAAARKFWVDEDWHAYKSQNFTFHICSDCNIDLRDVKSIQAELRNPRPNSPSYRRQMLWWRLDKLLIAAGDMRRA